MKRILVVDDEARIRDVVQYALERDGFSVLTAADGQAALELLQHEPVDLVVLDVLMPELDGISVCRALRREGDLPIIFLSSRGEEVDRVLGLELGGDDYITKPFSPRELVTRVKAVLRRARPEASAPPDDGLRGRLRYGGLEMDLDRHEARIDGTTIPFTATEFALLATLLAAPGRVFSRAQLLDQARGDDVHVTDRTVDTHVRRIRAKLRPHSVDPVETVHGVGYRARERPS